MLLSVVQGQLETNNINVTYLQYLKKYIYLGQFIVKKSLTPNHTELYLILIRTPV